MGRTILPLFNRLEVEVNDEIRRCEEVTWQGSTESWKYADLLPWQPGSHFALKQLLLPAGGLLKPGARNSQDDHNQQKYDMRTQMSLFKATACNYSFFWTDLLSCKQKQHLGRSTTMNFLGTINFFNPNGILLVNSTFSSHCETGVWDSVGSPSCCIDNFSDQSQAVRLYVCTLPLKTVFLVTSKCFCKNPVSFVSIILDRFTIVYCWSGDGASSCVHRPTLGQRSKPVSCLAPLLEIVPFVRLLMSRQSHGIFFLSSFQRLGQH